jgi:hypothetical protein
LIVTLESTPASVGVLLILEPFERTGDSPPHVMVAPAWLVRAHLELPKCQQGEARRFDCVLLLPVSPSSGGGVLMLQKRVEDTVMEIVGHALLTVSAAAFAQKLAGISH